MVKAAALTVIGPRLVHQCIKKNMYIYYLIFYAFFFNYYALTKYKTLVGKDNILSTGTKNKEN